MLNRLGLNRSPQHHREYQEISDRQEVGNFSKRKVLLPASVFNKMEKERSVSRQPRHDKSLTPTSHKLELGMQQSRSRPLLLIHKSKDENWHSKSNLKKHMCENCNSFMENQGHEQHSKHYNLKQKMRTVRDIGKRNEINELFQTITQKAKQIDEKKDQYQIEQMRLVQNFKRQKQKINEFYNKVSNILIKHRQGILSVIDKKQEDIVGELQSRMKAITNKIQTLSLLEQKVCNIIPGVEKLTEESFKQNINSLRSQYLKHMAHFKTPNINIKHISVKIGDEKYLTKQLVDVIEHFLHVNNLPIKKNSELENVAASMNSVFFLNLEQFNTSLNTTRAKIHAQQNHLEKYISIVEGQESESDCEMLLSKRS